MILLLISFNVNATELRIVKAYESSMKGTCTLHVDIERNGSYVNVAVLHNGEYSQTEYQYNYVRNTYEQSTVFSEKDTSSSLIPVVAGNRTFHTYTTCWSWKGFGKRTKPKNEVTFQVNIPEDSITSITINSKGLINSK